MNPFVVLMLKYLMPAVAWFLSLPIPGRSSRAAFQEAKNKAWIMSLVNHVEEIFPPRGTYKPLPELTEQCYAMGTFPALWAVEGLGNYYAETFRDRNLVQSKLLTETDLDCLPACSMTMLHAGIGLSFAKRSLEGLSSQSPKAELRKALEKFIQLCTDSSRRGYRGAALESLGLVTLILHDPAMARSLDTELQVIDRDAVSYLWRGAGRALYFHPKNFIPGWRSPWRGIGMCRQIAPHETARHNLRAGIAWATTVVNMRNPEIMERVLLHQGESDPDRDLFVNGVMSSMIMRYDTSPEDPYIQPFIQHVPQTQDSPLRTLWIRDIQKPCEMALERVYPVLKQRQMMEEVFHYQSLPELCRLS